ncbi:MAG: hypothetical protein P0Y56_15280 [Candidatus Andeanibacterium colombiense]|uniref:Uncharacterized protein n=1 Tax=Candidatus Andeanibacterium colombiense TaxID=3121345 RepID=A0AAJ5X876_9SPHN|nr:MAG: hypothetical protein P0Y56_15280 [Sphingomonadaceae bacterium]
MTVFNPVVQSTPYLAPVQVAPFAHGASYEWSPSVTITSALPWRFTSGDELKYKTGWLVCERGASGGI